MTRSLGYERWWNEIAGTLRDSRGMPMQLRRRERRRMRRARRAWERSQMRAGGTR